MISPSRAALLTGALLFPTTAAAQGLEIGQKADETGLEGSPVGPGIGIAVGDPSGIALAHRPGDWTLIQSTVGWSFTKGRLHVSADYVRNLVILQSESTPNLRYPLYVGLGGRFSVDEGGEGTGNAVGDARDDETRLGLRVPLGIALLPKTQAVDVFLEFAPGLSVFPDVDGTWDATLGARIYPWGRGKEVDDD